MASMKMVESRSLMQSLLSLAWVVEARDPYTGGHLWRVSQFSMLLAREIGCLKVEVARIGLGGFLHDLGKIGVPDRILNKPDKLTEEEYGIIKTHPRIGANLIEGHPLFELVQNAILLHHETPDGKGYPTGLAGEAIPMDARIVGLTDAFDAMTSSRPYRKGMPKAKALEIVAANLGTQFDRPLGEAFIKLGEQGRLDCFIGHTEPRIPIQLCIGCGTTVHVMRRHKDGDLVFCRNCGGGSHVHRDGDAISLTPLGRVGTPKELTAEVDASLINELVEVTFNDALTSPEPIEEGSFFSKLIGSFTRK